MRRCIKCGDKSDLDYGNQDGLDGAPVAPEPICIPCLEKHYPDAEKYLPVAFDAAQKHLEKGSAS